MEKNKNCGVIANSVQVKFFAPKTTTTTTTTTRKKERRERVEEYAST